MTQEEHNARHRFLHHAFDELLADYLHHHPGSTPRSATIEALLHWSYEQTQFATPTIVEETE